MRRLACLVIASSLFHAASAAAQTTPRLKVPPIARPAPAPRAGAEAAGPRQDDRRAASGIIVQGGLDPATDCEGADATAPGAAPAGRGVLAIGPKQDDPSGRGTLAIGPKQDDPSGRGTLAIGPKQDDPSGRGTLAIGPKQDDPSGRGTLAIGPKQDDPSGRGTLAIGPKQDDPSGRGALARPGDDEDPKAAGGSGRLAIGPKQDDPVGRRMADPQPTGAAAEFTPPARPGSEGDPKARCVPAGR